MEVKNDMIDMTFITGVLVLLSFIVGLVKITKPTLSVIAILIAMAVIPFVAPDLLTGIPVINSFFELVFAIMKGFGIGGIVKLGAGVIISKLVK